MVACRYEISLLVFNTTSLSILLITFTISLKVIGASAALCITNPLYSCNRTVLSTVGCNRTPVIGQLKQPIILSQLS